MPPRYDDFNRPVFAFTFFCMASGLWTAVPCYSQDHAANAPQAAVAADWPQWGGSPARNNTPSAPNGPTDWDVGRFDYQTGEWDNSTARNVKWVARLGSQTYGTPVVAGGRVFVGTNNGAGRLARYPADVDLGCLVCFDVATGEFLWQHSSEKLASGAAHDWPDQGICCAPLVEGDRLWFVTNRGEVRCLDTAGFHDDENDGPYTDEPATAQDEADVVWVLDMMGQLGTRQHNMCSCSVTAAGDLLFVSTSNGVAEEDHHTIPAPEAPSFIAVNKQTGKVVWTDNSPGLNILHGQWSSPAYAVVDGVPQVIFAGGDGWVYSFDPQGVPSGKEGVPGKSKLLWKFDANPKTTLWEDGGQGTRNSIIATPVVYQDRVYVAVGQDPDYGEGDGHLWCIDATRRGDISAELAVRADRPDEPLPPRRFQAVVPEEGEKAIPNPNSAALWHYSQSDQNGDGEIDFEETMHRSLSSVAVKDNLLYITDVSGLVHCLDATTGKVHWTYDMLAAAWGSPLVVDGKVYIGDEDGDVAVFRHSADRNEAMREEDGEWLPYYGEKNMGGSVYSTPIIADGVLYISNRSHLFAIE